MEIGSRWEIEAENGIHVCELIGMSDTGVQIRFVDTGHETEIDFEGIVYLAKVNAIRECI